MFFFNLLFCFLFTVAFSFSSMESMQECLQDPNCRIQLDQNYGKKITTAVNAFNPDLLKKINTVPYLVISNHTTSYFFSAIAVDHLKKTITSQCKSTIQPFNKFPFFYAYQGDTEAEGRYLNMNCFFVDYEQYKNLQKCISSEYFNIYSINSREIQVQWIERCKNGFISWTNCEDKQRIRIDTVHDRIICYKQNNKVYDAFVEIAKMDYASQNGRNIEDDVFKELPAEGTDFKNTCIPNCESCFSYEKCNQCQPQYSLFNNKCIKCEDNQKECLICNENQLLYENECLQQCPLGSVDQNRVCISCDEECKECNKSCIRCFNGFVLQEDKCQKECDQGFYPNRDTLQCQPCSLNCNYCNSNQVCITCESGFTIKNKKCVGNQDMNQIVIIKIVEKFFNMVIFLIIVILILYCINKTKLLQIFNPNQINNVQQQPQPLPQFPYPQQQLSEQLQQPLPQLPQPQPQLLQPLPQLPQQQYNDQDNNNFIAIPETSLFQEGSLNSLQIYNLEVGRVPYLHE